MFRDEGGAPKTARRALAIGFATALTTAFIGTNARAEAVPPERRGAEAAAANPRWSPRDSWVSRLDKRSARRLLGAPTPPPADVDFLHRRDFTPLAPEVLDWRAKDGANWVSPILNQGNCGSCVAFAAVATLETQMNVASGVPWLNPRYSTQALFACGGGSCDWGWFPHRAAQYLASRGAPDEACLPYTSGATGQDVECRAACADAGARSTKIQAFSQPSSWGSSPDAVKAALRKGPLMTTLTVYADFMTYGSGVYKRQSRETLGGHAVSMVGFDDEKRAWIVRNSWGTDWGMDGFAYVSYDDDSGIGRQTWAFETDPPGPFATVRNLRDRAYVAGSYALEAATNAPGATGVKARVQAADGGAGALEASCEGRECRIPLDVSSLPDGRYELRAEAVGAQAFSQPRYFYVANSKPALTLDWRLTGGGSGPLKGRVEFEVSSTSSSVPLSSLEFVVEKDGKEKIRRRADFVVPRMTVGWRTNLVENGTYQVKFVGRVATNLGETVVESRAAAVETRN